MQILKAKKYTLILQEEKESVVELHKQLFQKLTDLKEDHIILEIISKITSEEIHEFLDIANTKREQQTSFVLLSNTIDIDEVPDEIQVAPTLEEAKDILDMDTMARDLMS